MREAEGGRGVVLPQRVRAMLTLEGATRVQPGASKPPPEDAQEMKRIVDTSPPIDANSFHVILVKFFQRSAPKVFATPAPAGSLRATTAPS